jgi:hypothetical protein
MFRGRTHEFFVREPDAGDPQVRFDERGVEPESAAMWVKRQSIGTVSPTAGQPRHSSTLRLQGSYIASNRTIPSHPPSRVNPADRWVVSFA